MEVIRGQANFFPFNLEKGKTNYLPFFSPNKSRKITGKFFTILCPDVDHDFISTYMYNSAHPISVNTYIKTNYFYMLIYISIWVENEVENV